MVLRYCPAVPLAPFIEDIAPRKQGMIEQVAHLARINTGSHNVKGLEEAAGVLDAMFRPLAETHRRLELDAWTGIDSGGQAISLPLGPALSFSRRPTAPTVVLLMGHYDTVFEPGHPFQDVRLDGERMTGPGVADMKGGLVVLEAVVQAIERAPWRDSVGWHILLNPDEELGSVGSAPIIAAAAEGKTVGLVFEPSFPNGSIAGARKGSGTFTVVAKGRATHAGRDHVGGRNAIAALARATVAIDELTGTGDGVTVNVGTVHGGGKTNIVPDRAVLELNVRARTQDAANAVVKRIEDICRTYSGDGIRLEVHGGFTRPPRQVDEHQQRLLDLTLDVAHGQGLDVSVEASGGVSDGNNLSAAGLPNVDNLGVHGANIHSADEYMWIESLVTRAQLAVGLIDRLVEEGWRR